MPDTDPLVQALMEASGCFVSEAYPGHCFQHPGWIFKGDVCAAAEKAATRLAPFVAAQRREAAAEARGDLDAMQAALVEAGRLVEETDTDCDIHHMSIGLWCPVHEASHEAQKRTRLVTPWSTDAV